jgi:hypothetical protein
VIPPAHLVCLLYTTSTIHAKAILVPERAFAIEIHLVVSEKGVLDEFLDGREEILVEQLDLFVLAVRRFYRSRWLHGWSVMGRR